MTRGPTDVPTHGYLDRFLTAVHDVRSTGAGVPETSYYPAISRLLEDVGARLRPPVKPVIHISGGGAGIPDGGLFLARPVGPVTAGDPMASSAPERGAIEVKPPDRDLTRVVATVQIRKYLDRYGKVLVTTMREWALVVTDPATGRAQRLETFRLAKSEDAFWALAADPTQYAEANEDEFVGFLDRALGHDAPLSSPKDLAWLLAAHARTALKRIEGRRVSALDQLRDALRDALGVTFEGRKGEWFFRTTLVQTLFYGVFSAWVLWHREGPLPDERFQWRNAAWHLRVPLVSVLFERIATPSTLRPLGVEEVMDWTEDVLARVDRDRFFARFEQDKAVQYFYEPFLEHYDSALREEFGVWYTPAEVVDYMVDRVDRTLRDQLGVTAGLADDRVYVLDPCVGTGSFLVAVLDRIAASLPDNDALRAHDVKTAAMRRIFGFELLPAPFVVAHLQLGLRLADIGAPLDPDQNERVAVYLTNALTGWVDGDGPPRLPFPELEDERDAAHAVKRSDRILVVLGNPPYYQYAGMNSVEETGLVERYKRGIVTKHSLNDLYVRFYAVAERQIVEGTGHGIVCLISNFSFLHEPGFVQMRRSLLGSFDDVWIDCLNGDSRETGKKTPDGRPDPSIFATPFNPQGIQVGTAISTYLRRPDHPPEGQAVVHYRDFWGDSKKDQLADLTTNDDPNHDYQPVELREINRWAFRPGVMTASYGDWPQMVELAAMTPALGLNENRGSALVDPDPNEVTRRMRDFLDPTRSLEALEGTPAAPLARPWARYDPEGTRQRLIAAGGYQQRRLVRFLSRPLDVQWAYVDPTKKLWNEVRARDLLPHAEPGSRFLLVRRRAPRADDGAAVLPATCLGDQHVLHKDAYYIPFRLTGRRGDGELFGDDDKPNLSPTAERYLSELGIAPDHRDYEALLWWHATAIGYSPAYLAENAGGIAADWPRVPLPASAEVLVLSAALGRRLAGVLDPLVNVDGLAPYIGPVRRVDGQPVQPDRGDLAVTAQWGVLQPKGVFPGRGRLSARDYTDAERTALGDISRLGTALDVFMNDAVYWSCIPEAAWEFKIGGFQVLKKWLSYREHGPDEPSPLLGRPLSPGEARGFTELAQRITLTVLLGPELDANYRMVSDATYPWANPTDATDSDEERDVRDEGRSGS